MYQWFPEVSHFCQGVPTILVGTKTDLRQDPETRRMLAMQGLKPISFEQGTQVAREIGASRYIECSAKRSEGVIELFDQALRESMKRKLRSFVKKRKNCVLL